MTQQELYATTITTLAESLSALLDAAKLTSLIPTGQTILIKPNLVEALVPPVTTPVFLVELLIDYLQKRIVDVEIIIGEGTGFDLNRYRTPDFTLLDASIGMAEAHLWGAHCDPPVNMLVASADPVALDSYGASLLGHDWRKIKYIQFPDTVLGTARTEATKVLP